MAQSPSHKFGQIIGNVLEEMLFFPLSNVAKRHGLYLDHKHPRKARRNKRKVCWRDHKGNDHDLDFVLEAGGTEEAIGTPRAFVESAWRRYTKHSRNKAQEMQGAIIPLAETYSKYHPFLGAVLAGDFTEGSLQQLRSHGFTILYYPYESIISAFASARIDAFFDEDTSDLILQRSIAKYETLPESRRKKIAQQLEAVKASELARFIEALEATLNRGIERICVLTLHGGSFSVKSIADAIAYIEQYDETQTVKGFIRYEIQVCYSNGDKVNGEFESRETALLFLSKIT